MAEREMKTVSVRLPEEAIARLQEHAALLGEAAPTLMRRWLLERLEMERFNGPHWRNHAAAVLANAAINAKGAVLQRQITSHDVGCVKNLLTGDDKTIGNMWRPLTTSVQAALNDAVAEHDVWVRNAFFDAVLNETQVALGTTPRVEVTAFLATLFAGLVGQGVPTAWQARLQGRKPVPDFE